MQKLQPTKEIVVDGQKYLVQFYSPTFGLTLYAKLLRLFGEPLIKLLGTFKGKDVAALKAADVELDSAGAAIQSLFANLKDEDLVPLMQDILSQTLMIPSRDPVNEHFETVFMGRYGHAFKLVVKTLGVQYPDFLGGIAKRLSAGSAASQPAQKEAAN